MIYFTVFLLTLWSQMSLVTESVKILTGSSMKIANSNGDRICRTESCNYFGKTFLANLDENIGPCDDFYNFFCAKTKDTVDSVVDKNIAANINFMMSKLNSNDGSENLSRLQRLYSSCTEPNPNNLDSLRNLTKRLGGFPLGGQKSGWNQLIPFDWQEATIRLRRVGVKLDQFFSFDIKFIDKQYLPSVGVIEQDALKMFGFERNLYEELVKILFPGQDIDFKLHLTELRDFRAKFRKIMNLPDDNLLWPKNVKDLGMEIPDLEWKKLLVGLTDDVVTGKYQLYVKEFDKVKLIANLLKQTKPEVLANHMMLSIIESYAPFVTLPGSGSRLHDDIPKPRCDILLEKYLGIALSVEYFNRYVSREVIEFTSEMIESIKTEIKMMIDEAQWIAQKSTRAAAKAKIDTMTFEIGLAEKLKESKTSEWFYSGLTLDSERPIENLMKIDKVRYDRKFGDFAKQKVELFAWQDYDQYVSSHSNAFYYKEFNTVRIMAGIINPVYVDSSRLASINFGVLGSTIAHEIMHAFDLRGILVDANNKKDVIWWDSQSKEWYKHKTECLVKQYDGLKVDGANWLVNGTATLSENIADNAGAEAAYRAFVRWQDSQEQTGFTRLDGIDLEPKQLFWASYAARWCNSRVQTKPLKTHSPAKYRVNKPLSNYEEFSNDFQCPNGCDMIPKTRCIVW